MSPGSNGLGGKKGKEREMGKAEQFHPLGDSHINKFKMSHDDAQKPLFSGSICGKPGRREGLVSHPVLPSSQRDEM